MSWDAFERSWENWLEREEERRYSDDDGDEDENDEEDEQLEDLPFPEPQPKPAPVSPKDLIRLASEHGAQDGFEAVEQCLTAVLLWCRAHGADFDLLLANARLAEQAMFPEVTK